ncbi:MAG: hypothetical protein IKP58_08835 [Victivallales bacterium]|nr:hypothetical protein [Victivallales bacterium]
MSKWYVQDAWKERLAAIGITDLQSALAFRGGTVMSDKKRSRTCKVALSGDGIVFVKHDLSTAWQATLRALVKFQKPITKTECERLSVEHLKRLGFKSYDVVAWGAKTCCGLPDRAVMVTLPVPGRPMEDIWHDKSVSEERKNEALKIALETLEALQQAGCNWRKDCKPEHFFVTDDNQVYLIDVERMRFGWRSIDEEECRFQKERFMSLLMCND